MCYVVHADDECNDTEGDSDDNVFDGDDEDEDGEKVESCRRRFGVGGMGMEEGEQRWETICQQPALHTVQPTIPSS